MNNIHFYKYQGTGNDFVIMDNRNGQYDWLTDEQVNELCDRRFGIGADGLMLLNKSEDYDFAMKYYNADGRESSMCGNGGRCLVAFAHKMGVGDGNLYFIAVDGEHEATMDGDSWVNLKMQNVDDVEHGPLYYYLNTGSPHFVKFVEDVQAVDVFNEGRGIRYNDRFDDPNLPGEMRATVALRPVLCGTELSIVQEGLPEAIPVEMCYLGWQESLEQLARLVEPEIPG